MSRWPFQGWIQQLFKGGEVEHSGMPLVLYVRGTGFPSGCLV